MFRSVALRFLMAGSAALAMAGAARATETAVPVTPSGGTDVGQALLPPPGLYGAVAILPFNQDDRFYDRTGKAVADNANVRFNMQTVAFALSYVYPAKVFGGSIASDVSVPFTSQNSKIGLAPSHNNTSVGDIYVDFFNWSRHLGASAAPGAAAPTLVPGFTVAFGMAMKMPTGAYSLKNSVNLGNNVFVLVPNAAITYTGAGIKGFSDDTQLSAKLFYGVPLENPATHYQSGNVMAVDFSTTEAFGRLRAGLAGTFANQTTNDRLPDGTKPLDGKRFQQFQIGPVFTYAIPKTKIALKLKYLRTVYVRNDINDQFLLAALAMKF